MNVYFKKKGAGKVNMLVILGLCASSAILIGGMKGQLFDLPRTQPSRGLNLDKTTRERGIQNLKPNKNHRIPDQQARAFYNELQLASMAAAKEYPSPALLYGACCGLGHRLMRQSAAFHLASRAKIPNVLVEWGDMCNVNKYGYPDMHGYLFGDGPLVTELKYNETRLIAIENQKVTPGWNITMRFGNEVDGYHNYDACDPVERQVVVDKAISDERFYRQLRSLFRFNDRVESFAEKNRFSERIVVGFHLRTGNGEIGDFTDKNRGIESLDAFLIRVVETTHTLIRNIEAATKNDYVLPPLIFVASDSHSTTEKLANVTRKYNIETVAIPQPRLKEGAGVTYNANFDTDTTCLESWISQFMDASLLGAADVLVAPRYSSFSQALPLVTVLSGSIVNAGRKQQENIKSNISDDSDRFTNRLFCEVTRYGDGMRCYDDYIDWTFAENEIFMPNQTIWNEESERSVAYGKQVKMLC